MKADSDPQFSYRKTGKCRKLTPNPSIPIEKQVVKKADSEPQYAYRKTGKWRKLTRNRSIHIEKHVSEESWLGTPIYL